eukprot:7664880-Prorocentrum_lima.AAC.1
MTSSLVGSEMCIRDRDKWHAVTPTIVFFIGVLQQHRIAQATTRRFAPVSYTHLTLPTICSV